MTILFSIIFCICMAGGWAWGYLNGYSYGGYAVSLMVAGFIGSSIIALLFSWLYFFQKETDKEKILRLQQEINEIKDVKRLEQ